MSVILCTAGYDHTIRFWEALSGICCRTIQHPDSQVNRLCITPDKRFLAAAGHHAVKLYDIKSTNPNPVLSFEGHTGNITGVAFHCEGKWMVTSSEDGTVKIWETRTGAVQRSYNHGSPVNDVVIHPNQGEIISCDRGGSVRIWDLAVDTCSYQLIPEEDVSLSSVTVARNKNFLCAANNVGNVFVWQLLQEYGNTYAVPVTQFSAHTDYITRITVSPDGKKLATCSADHTAKIWEVPEPESLQLVSSEEPPKPFTLEARLQSHQRWVWDGAFSADSAYFVTACSDHYARLWELRTLQIVQQYNGHHRGTVCVALNDFSDAWWDNGSSEEETKGEKGRQRRRPPDGLATMVANDRRIGQRVAAFATGAGDHDDASHPFADMDHGGRNGGGMRAGLARRGGIRSHLAFRLAPKTAAVAGSRSDSNDAHHEDESGLLVGYASSQAVADSSEWESINSTEYETGSSASVE